MRRGLSWGVKIKNSDRIACNGGKRGLNHDHTSYIMKTPGFTLRVGNSFHVTHRVSRFTFHGPRFACLAALLALSGALSALAQTDGTASATNAMPEADKVWKETSKLLVPPMPPAEWQMQKPTQEGIQRVGAQKGKLAAEAEGKSK